MNKIKNKILVLSGKGGVGKTTVAVNLAVALSKNKKTGLLDVDIHGPNVPKMLNLEGNRLEVKDDKLLPVKVNKNLYVISIAFLLEKENSAVIWRGPMKHKMIKRFVEDVEWGDLDYLIVDLPPGTGDEAISVSQLLSDITGAVIVATPQQVALMDIKKAIDFARSLNIPIIGLVENMAGDIFGGGSVRELADSEGINFLGTLKLDKEIARSGDSGKPFVMNNSEPSKEFNEITKKIISFSKVIA